MIAALVAMLVSMAPPAEGAGAVLVPELRGKLSGARSETRVWVSAGDPATPLEGPLPGGAFEVGKPIPVPEGRAWVEVGTERVEGGANRVQITVKAKAVSVVPMALVSLAVEPQEAQAADACKRWSGAFELALQPLDGPAGPVVTRVVTEDAEGLALVPAGYYRITWNGGGIEVSLPPWTHYHVETGRVAPLRESGARVAEVEGGEATLRLCARRPTRLLARPWAVVYTEPMSEPPFSKRVWAPLVVPADERKGGPFAPIKRKPGRGELPAAEAAAEPLWVNP